MLKLWRPVIIIIEQYSMSFASWVDVGCRLSVEPVKVIHFGILQGFI